MESTVVSLIAAVLLTLVMLGAGFDTPEREFLDLPMPVVFVMLLMIAPPLETLVFQAFPIFVVRRLEGSIRSQILVSTVLFSAAHFPEGIATGVSAGIIGGLYFAFAYAHWRSRSRWQALWITTVCHAIHNGIAFLLLLISGRWS